MNIPWLEVRSSWSTWRSPRGCSYPDSDCEWTSPPTPAVAATWNASAAAAAASCGLPCPSLRLQRRRPAHWNRPPNATAVVVDGVVGVVAAVRSCPLLSTHSKYRVNVGYQEGNACFSIQVNRKSSSTDLWGGDGGSCAGRSDIVRDLREVDAIDTKPNEINSYKRSHVHLRKGLQLVLVANKRQSSSQATTVHLWSDRYFYDS